VVTDVSLLWRNLISSKVKYTEITGKKKKEGENKTRANRGPKGSFDKQVNIALHFRPNRNCTVSYVLLNVNTLSPFTVLARNRRLLFTLHNFLIKHSSEGN